MSWNTPTQLASNIALRFSDFDEGEQRFQGALDTAHEEIVFRLGIFDDNSFVEKSPFGGNKKNAVDILKVAAEWKRAGAFLYVHKAQVELQFGQSGTPSSTPDGFNIGAFTPEKNTQADAYFKRGRELQNEYEAILTLIVPNTNMPYLAVAGGRSDFTDDGTYWGTDAWT